MKNPRDWKKLIFSDLGVLILLALAWVVVVTIASAIGSLQYGFHRDELAFLDDGLHLDWGFVETPPFTAFLARLAWSIFGVSTVGVRLIPTLFMGAVIVLTGILAREFGGGRRAQVVAAVAAAISPLILFSALFFSYTTFDFFWWALCSVFVARLLKTGDSRWWLGIGVVLGLGMLTKFTIAFLALGIVGGVLLTPARRYLKSPWLYAGAALAFLIFSPNLIWQIQHQFLTFDFLGNIHSRDIGIGRTSGFLLGQLYGSANPAVIPLWVSGLIFLFFQSEGKSWRLLGWMYLIPLAAFLATQGRFYYLAPAYSILIAAGSYWIEKRQWKTLIPSARFWRGLLYGALVVCGCGIAALILPLAPVNSEWWKISMAPNGELREELGWNELVQTVAGIHASLPADQKVSAGIMAGNYGEAGAVNLLGRAYGLPRAVSGINSYWLWGYGDPPPQTLIVIGFKPGDADHFFVDCQIAGHTSNRFGVLNEETRDHPDIFVCHGLRTAWPELWKTFRWFG